MAQDISFTLSPGSSISSGTSVFSNCNDNSCLSQFNYLIISGVALRSPTDYFKVGVKYSTFQFPFDYTYFDGGFLVIDISDPYLHIDSIIFSSNHTLSNFAGPVVFTLSENLSSDCLPSPSGTISITENGSYDVSTYASAEVDVPPVMGDYHDDLVRGINAIYVLAGTILVIYFFYCIYRMIIKNVGDNK